MIILLLLLLLYLLLLLLLLLLILILIIIITITRGRWCGCGGDLYPPPCTPPPLSLPPSPLLSPPSLPPSLSLSLAEALGRSGALGNRTCMSCVGCVRTCRLSYPKGVGFFTRRGVGSRRRGMSFPREHSLSFGEVAHVLDQGQVGWVVPRLLKLCNHISTIYDCILSGQVGLP